MRVINITLGKGLQGGKGQLVPEGIYGKTGRRNRCFRGKAVVAENKK